MSLLTILTALFLVAPPVERLVQLDTDRFQNFLMKHGGENHEPLLVSSLPSEADLKLRYEVIFPPSDGILRALVGLAGGYGSSSIPLTFQLQTVAEGASRRLVLETLVRSSRTDEMNREVMTGVTSLMAGLRAFSLLISKTPAERPRPVLLSVDYRLSPLLVTLAGSGSPATAEVPTWPDRDPCFKLSLTVNSGTTPPSWEIRVTNGCGLPGEPGP